jgi:hypothetical protein
MAQTLPTVTAGRQYHASTSLNATYDSNFARSSATQAARRGIEPHEYVLRPQVSVDVSQPLGRQSVFLRGSAAYDLHRENTQLDRARGDVQGGYIATLGFCQGSVVGNYAAAQSDLEELDSPTVKNLREITSVAVGAQCGRPGSFQASTIVQRTENQNSAKIQRTADSTVETLAVQLGYDISNIGQVGLVYNYANNEFPNRIILGRPIGDGFFTQTYGLSLARKFGARIDVSAHAGRTSVKREFAPAGTNLKFTSTTYAGQATYKLGSRLVVELQGARAVIPTVRAGKLYDITTSGEISGQYKLGSRFVVNLGHRIADVDSNTDTTFPTAVVTNSRTNSTFASIAYRQSRRASLKLDVRYDDRKTNLADFNYTSTRVGLTAEVGF